jgi:NAD(P)-dependent dehydrogenase (short-subunit alcohol dehydrogenase family)
VVLLARRKKPLQALEKRFPGRGIPLVCDLSAKNFDAHRLIKIASSLAGGPIQGLIQCAAQVQYHRSEKIKKEDLRKLWQLNFEAPLFLAIAFAEHLKAAKIKNGSCVSISSTLAHQPAEGTLSYSVSKAALLHASRALALEWAHQGVRFNSISPGVFASGMVPPSRRAKLAPLHPLGRVGAVEDLVPSLINLLDSEWTTGSDLIIDGGLLLR